MTMKRIVILFIVAVTALLMRAGMSNSIEYGHLYIAGDATDYGWNLSAAGEMPKILNGVFEWTGHLKGGKEFKFMNNLEAWHKHIVSAKSGVVAEIGKDYPLDFYSDWYLDSARDRKFKVAESGNYTVTVDLISMRLVISKPIEQAKWPERFYLVGSATNNEIIEIPKIYEVEYKKAVTLREGYVKLIDTPTITAETKYYVPRFTDVDITYGQNCDVKLYPSQDSETAGWRVSLPGDYLLYLDCERHTFQCRKYKQYKTLYIVGGCCELNWNYWDKSNNQFHQDPDNPDVMVWEGELRIGWDKKVNPDGSLSEPDEPNKFKIITVQDWFRDTYHPYRADALAEGESAARITGGGDVKWTIRKNGVYRLEMNTKTETLNAIFLSPKEAEPAEWNMADVEMPQVESDKQENNYYNLQGMPLTNPTSGFVIIVNGGKARKCILK